MPENWSRIELGAVTDAAVCRSLPLLADEGEKRAASVMKHTVSLAAPSDSG